MLSQINNTDQNFEAGSSVVEKNETDEKLDLPTKINDAVDDYIKSVHDRWPEDIDSPEKFASDYKKKILSLGGLFQKTMLKKKLKKKRSQCFVLLKTLGNWLSF